MIPICFSLGLTQGRLWDKVSSYLEAVLGKTSERMGNETGKGGAEANGGELSNRLAL